MLRALELQVRPAFIQLWVLFSALFTARFDMNAGLLILYFIRRHFDWNRWPRTSPIFVRSPGPSCCLGERHYSVLIPLEHGPCCQLTSLFYFLRCRCYYCFSFCGRGLAWHRFVFVFGFFLSFKMEIKVEFRVDYIDEIWRRAVSHNT